MHRLQPNHLIWNFHSLIQFGLSQCEGWGGRRSLLATSTCFQTPSLALRLPLPPPINVYKESSNKQIDRFNLHQTDELLIVHPRPYPNAEIEGRAKGEYWIRRPGHRKPGKRECCNVLFTFFLSFSRSPRPPLPPIITYTCMSDCSQY